MKQILRVFIIVNTIFTLWFFWITYGIYLNVFAKLLTCYLGIILIVVTACLLFDTTKTK